LRRRSPVGKRLLARAKDLRLAIVAVEMVERFMIGSP